MLYVQDGVRRVDSSRFCQVREHKRETALKEKNDFHSTHWGILNPWEQSVSISMKGSGHSDALTLARDLIRETRVILPSIASTIRTTFGDTDSIADDTWIEIPSECRSTKVVLYEVEHTVACDMIGVKKSVCKSGIDSESEKVEIMRGH